MRVRVGHISTLHLRGLCESAFVPDPASEAEGWHSIDYGIN